MESVRELIEERDTLDTELNEVNEKLELMAHLNYDKNLVDREGFPREDLDFGKLTEYRLLKKRQNELLNDHKSLTKLIKKGIEEFHQETKDDAEVKIKAYEEEAQRLKEELQRRKEEEERDHQMMLEAVEDDESTEANFPPFARIKEVKIGSPADKGGVKVGDLLTRYGKINYLNHNELKGLIEETRNNIGSEIKVLVNRSGVVVELGVTPGTWDGPGVLGCRFDVL